MLEDFDTDIDDPQLWRSVAARAIVHGGELASQLAQAQRRIEELVNELREVKVALLVRNLRGETA